MPAAGFAADDRTHRSCPVAGAVAVGGIDTTSARVAAVLQLGKGSAAYWFEYWVLAGHGAPDRRRDRDPRGGRQGHHVAVSRTLTGLPPGTTYSVRLVATSSPGTGTGEPATFTTAAVPASAPASELAGPEPGARPAARRSRRPAPRWARRSSPPPSRAACACACRAATRFVDLPQAASVPVGSVVDTRAGAIDAHDRAARRREPDGTFWGGAFQVRQAPRNGHDRPPPARRALRPLRRARGRAPSRRGKKPRVVRRLWGKDHRRFRTHGRDSVATVRGTTWVTTDRCDGTLTKVTEGKVAGPRPAPQAQRPGHGRARLPRPPPRR